MENGKKELLRTVKFTLFSISAGGIETASEFILVKYLYFNYWVAYTIALTLSVLWNFTLNRKFTFQSATNVKIAMLKVLGYYAVFAPASIIWTWFFADFKGYNGIVVYIITILINFITEYLFQRIYVFGKSIDTAKK